jgi:histidyl-tRNA synthetase
VELDLGFGRGIGFYSQMIFEILAPTPDGLIEVCGGGRYDGLARVLGSDRDDRGVGFAFGLERVDSVLGLQGRAKDVGFPDRLLILPGPDDALPHAVRLATMLRAAGTRTVLGPELAPDPIAPLGFESRASRCVVVGGDPKDDRSLVLHDLRDGSRKRMKLKELVNFLKEDSGDRMREPAGPPLPPHEAGESKP